MTRLNPVAIALASAALLAMVAMMVEGREQQGFMYIEKAKLNSFSKLENIALWKPRPDTKRSDENSWTKERKKEALQLLPEMMSYIKHNTMSSDQVAAQIERLMASEPKFPTSKKDKAKIVKGNPFERAFAGQFVDGTQRVGPDLKRQIKGNYRGGLIAISELQWSYGARDVSQDTEQLYFNNRKRNLASNYLGTLENGAVNGTVIHKGQTCDQAEAFNVIIDIPVNMHEALESVMLYLPAAVVDEYTLILPEDQTQSTYEKVCFDYPLMLYSYITRDAGYMSNVAHSCNERFCTDYYCLCGRALFNAAADPWNIIPAFCPLASFYPDFLIADD